MICIGEHQVQECFTSGYVLYLDQEVVFNRLQGFLGLFAADCVAFSAVEVPIRISL